MPDIFTASKKLFEKYPLYNKSPHNNSVTLQLAHPHVKTAHNVQLQAATESQKNVNPAENITSHTNPQNLPKHENINIYRHTNQHKTPHQPNTQDIPGLFSSFIKNPHKFTFIHQEKDEKVLLFSRRHFATNYSWVIGALIAFAVPPLLIPLWQSQNLFRFPPSIAFIIALLSFYYLIILGFIFFNYLHWFYNIGIVTQKRIMDIDFLHLSYIDIAITQLPEIEDVVHKQKGFFSSFFDYGDVIAHTVAGKEDFVFDKIPHPTQVVELISKLISD